MTRYALPRLARASSGALPLKPRTQKSILQNSRKAATAAAVKPASAQQPSSSTQTSNLPPDFQNAIRRDASLPTPDPPPDSQTAQLIHNQSPSMVPTYVRPPLVLHKGEGCTLWDVENRAYLDFTAGIAVNALGHADGQLTHIMSAQAATLVHCSNLYHNPWTGLLSQVLVERTRETGGMKDAGRAFVCNSGSEANEAAVKFARKVGKNRDPSGKKHKVVSFRNAFHGRTFGALSATPNPKYQKPFGPMVPGFVTGEYNDVEGVKGLVDEETCGVIVEPIQGEGGVHSATPDFLRALRKRCDEVGAVLIYDEIQCGMGRTGSFWAHTDILDTDSDSHPDVLTTAKALGNGFPVGATLVTEEVSNNITTGDHGTTFGGNPMACRIAHNIVNRLSATPFLAEVKRKGEVMRSGLARLAEKFPVDVKEIRGSGLMIGVQLTGKAADVVTACRERGLLIITCGVETLRVVPPLIIEDAQIQEGLKILEEAMGVVFEGAGKPAGNEAAVEGVRAEDLSPPHAATKGQQEMGDNPMGRA